MLQTLKLSRADGLRLLAAVLHQAAEAALWAALVCSLLDPQTGSFGISAVRALWLALAALFAAQSVWLSASCAAGVEAQAQETLLRRAARFSPAQFVLMDENAWSGASASALRSGVFLLYVLLPRAVFLCAAFALLAFTRLPAAGLCLLVGSLCSFAGLLTALRLLPPVLRRAQHAERRARIDEEDLRHGEETVRVLGRLGDELAYLNASRERARDAKRLFRRDCLLFGLWICLPPLSLFVCFPWLPGGAAEALLLVVLPFASLLLTSLALPRFAALSVAAARLRRLLFMPPLVSFPEGEAPEPVSGAAKLEFEDVYYAYPGAEDYALSALNFSVRPGQTIGVVGGADSGKSTLAGLILRFFDPVAGRLLLDGAPLTAYPRDALVPAVVLVSDQAFLLPGTYLSNLCPGENKPAESLLSRALTAAGLDKIVESAGGLNASLAEDDLSSAALACRVAVARALLGRPQSLLLDGLDAVLGADETAALRASIRASRLCPTLLLFSRRVAAVREADAILVLDRGRMEGFASHGALYQTSEVYKELCVAQMDREEALS